MQKRVDRDRTRDPGRGEADGKKRREGEGLGCGVEVGRQSLKSDRRGRPERGTRPSQAKKRQAMDPGQPVLLRYVIR